MAGFWQLVNVRRLSNIVVAVMSFGAVLTAAGQDTTTRVRLVLSAETVRPGDTVVAGISLRMQPEWHTYWRFAGDSGIPTKVRWELPPGVSAGEIQWPVPEKIVTPPLTTYGYSGEAVLLVPLKVAANASPGPVTVKATVEWQECKDLCLQGKTELSAQFKVGTEAQPSANIALIEAAKTRLPLSGTNVSVAARWEKDDENRPMILEWATAEKPAEVDFFPFSNKGYDVKGETERQPAEVGRIRIRKLVSKDGDNWPAKIDGLLVSKAAKDGPAKGYEVSLALAPLAGAGGVAADASLLVMLIFAFVGGLILNIMPCVLPVISLKVLGFVNQAKETPARVRGLGWVYGMGVLVSFLALALLAIGVQRAGGSAGWSTALQNSQFRVVITVLITLVALNLFGVFEVNLGGGTMGAAAELTGKHGMAGAFFNGVLATVLATPCTAPFLATAVGFAFTQPPVTIILVFLAVGAGLAAPFVLLCWQPGWLRFLPRPGVWMQRFKVAMGFPMLATAVWLFWPTATRLGKSGVLWLGLFLVALALATWVWGEFVQRGTKRRALAMLISLLLAGGAYGFILEKQLHWRSPSAASRDAIDWQVWSPEAVAKARAEGHPVLVEFTADLCLNCELNRLTSIDIKQTRDKLKEIGAVTLMGDYTDQDPAIGKELKRFGRPGVPLVLVYPADKNLQPQVLPTLLTPGIVLDALERAAAKTNTSTAGLIH